jgi:hypothetical protein
MYYLNLTISGSGILKTQGYRVYVSGTLDISAAGAAAIQCNGSAVTAASGATAGLFNSQTSYASLPWNLVNQPNGGAGSTTAGVAAVYNSNGGIVYLGFSGGGGNGGVGGAGVSAGGAATAGQTINVSGVTAASRTDYIDQLQYILSISPIWCFAGLNGGGGGGGGGDATNAGGGGGGGGCSGGPIYIAANIINRSGSTAAGAIQSNGSAGGTGGNGAGSTNSGGGGAGGGGSGGVVQIVYSVLLGATATNCIQANGGAGGVGGTGVGTGKGGAGGTGGGGGSVFLINVNNVASVTNQTFAAGTAGGTTANTVGGTSGAGAAISQSL